MNKEEFIKLIESLELEIINEFEIKYLKEKPSSWSSYGSDNKEKTISFNKEVSE